MTFQFTGLCKRGRRVREKMRYLQRVASTVPQVFQRRVWNKDAEAEWPQRSLCCPWDSGAAIVRDEQNLHLGCAPSRAPGSLDFQHPSRCFSRQHSRWYPRTTFPPTACVSGASEAAELAPGSGTCFSFETPLQSVSFLRQQGCCLFKVIIGWPPPSSGLPLSCPGEQTSRDPCPLELVGQGTPRLLSMITQGSNFQGGPGVLSLG